MEQVVAWQAVAFGLAALKLVLADGALFVFTLCVCVCVGGGGAGVNTRSHLRKNEVRRKHT